MLTTRLGMCYLNVMYFRTLGAEKLEKTKGKIGECKCNCCFGFVLSSAKNLCIGCQ